MKIYQCRLNDPVNFITVKAAHFTEPRRERLRKLVLTREHVDHVWFEDEQPPLEVLLKIQEVAISEELRRIDPNGGTQKNGEEA